MNVDIRQCTTIDDVNRELRKIRDLFVKLNIFIGNGSPENEVVADKGSLYLNLRGGANTTLFIKESGDKTKSGWIAK